ncbi:hypothetical protein, partial [Streptomyces venezuelae]|uniref:hypothetical protein n=1 Tax=Streptomyces venezuelae TaxID=54571 RepID=UPI00278C7442
TGPPAAPPAGPPSGPPSGPLSPGPSSADGPSPDRRSPRRRIVLFALVGGLVLVVGLVGVLVGAGAFGGGGDGGPSGGGSGNVREAEATAGVRPSSAEPEAAPSSLGVTQRYGDGVEVTVSEPVPFTPAAGAVGHTAGDKAVTLSVTVRNGSAARLDLAAVTVLVRDGAGRELGRIFDSESELGSGLTGSVGPGKRAVAAYGFDVPPGGGEGGSVLDVEVTVGIDRPPLFWTGKAP